MRLPPGQRFLDADGTLALLQEWIGSPVVVSIGASDSVGDAVSLKGTLDGGRTSIEPDTGHVMECFFHLAEYPDASFSLYPWAIEDEGAIADAESVTVVMGHLTVIVLRRSPPPPDLRAV